MKIVFFTSGCLFFAIGFIGAFTPVLPTTPFMLLALMSFSKSSPRLHAWLYNHKIFGPPLQKWDQHRVIPLFAKRLSVFFMVSSQIVLYAFIDIEFWIKGASTLIVIYGCWFVLSKPSGLKE
jgi:uncharacterized protein